MAVIDHTVHDYMAVVDHTVHGESGEKNARPLRNDRLIFAVDLHEVDVDELRHRVNRLPCLDLAPIRQCGISALVSWAIRQALDREIGLFVFLF